MPGAPGYTSTSPNPFVNVPVVATLTDASGKEVWWFKSSLFTSPKLETLPPERLLQNGYQFFMSQMLQAMRKDGILTEQRAPQ